MMADGKMRREWGDREKAQQEARLSKLPGQEGVLQVLWGRAN